MLHSIFSATVQRIGLAFAIVFFFVVAASSVEAQSKPDMSAPEFILATGDEEGVYYRIGGVIAKDLREHGINVQVISSEGSLQNLDLMASNLAHFCIAQADVLQTQWPSNQALALVPLYTETVHILVKSLLPVQKLSDLRNKRISVGPAGGGAERNAWHILDAADVDAKLLNLNYDEAKGELIAGRLHAAFMTIGYPAETVRDAIENKRCFLLEPDFPIARQLVNEELGFVLSTIPSGTYPHQAKPITTLGVPAVLAAKSDLDSELVERVTAHVASQLQDYLGQANVTPDPQNPLERMEQFALPLHPGAVAYYDEQGLMSSTTLKRWFNVGIGPVLLALIAIFTVLRASALSRFFRKHPASRALFLLFLLWIVGSLIMFYAETRNDNFATFFGSLWATLVNWISFGSQDPTTATGRITSAAMAFVGIGGLSWLFGEVAVDFFKRRMKETNMCKTMNNHFVIINWNAMGSEVVDQVRAMQREIGASGDVVAVTDSPEAVTADVVHLDVDPVSKDLVRLTNMVAARSVILLSAANASPDEADARNILIAMNIANLFPKDAVRRPHFVVEILNPGKVHLLEALTLDFEVVSSQTVASDLIVQVAGNPGLTQIYEDLLTNTDDSCEIYSMALAPKWYGKSFLDLCLAAIDLKKNGSPILPLAIMRDGKVHVNPNAKTIPTIKEGDTLFAVCGDLKELKELNQV